MKVYAVAFVLVALACPGVSMSGAAADAAPSDAERIAALEALQADRSSGPDRHFNYPSRLTIRMDGEVYLGDGGTVPPGTMGSMNIVSPDGVNRFGINLSFDGNAFHAELPVAGEVTILVLAPGYAPTVHGPVTLPADATTDGVRIPLEPVVPAHVQFVDESGTPIAGVTAQVVVNFGDSTVSTSPMQFESDEDGLISIPQGSVAIPTDIEVYHPGYMREHSQNLVVEPNDTLVWTLRADRPFQGRVVDARSGQPIAGAKVAPDFGSPSRHLGSEFSVHSSREPETSIARAKVAPDFGSLFQHFPREFSAHFPREPETSIASGSDGRFTLHELDDSKDHWFVVQADGFGIEYLKVPAGWSDEQVIELSPRVLRGRITGALATLGREFTFGARAVRLSMTLPDDFSASTHRHLSRSAIVDFEGYEGTFVLEDLPPGTVNLSAGAERMEIDLVDAVTEVEIALDSWPQYPDRAFRLQLIAPEGAPPAEGSLTMLVSHGPSPVHGREERVLKVTGGLAETMVPAPSRVTLRWDGIPGYLPVPPDPATAQRGALLIEPDDAPFELDLALERVGAIRVRLEGDEDLISHFIRVAIALERSQTSWRFEAIQAMSIQGLFTIRPGMSEAVIMPLPLGTAVELVVESPIMPTFSARETVTLTRENPIADVTVILPEMRHVQVLVVDADGLPLEGEQVTLLGEEYGRMTATTNEQGCVRFLYVSSAQSYIARVEAHGNRPAAEAVALLSRMNESQETLITLDAAQL